jgi:hypothetical protein
VQLIGTPNNEGDQDAFSTTIDYRKYDPTQQIEPYFTYDLHG